MSERASSPSLAAFADELTRLVDSTQEEALLMPRVEEALRRLVSTDDWLDADHAKPDPQYYQQYLLYADPRDRFSVVSFVWGPGQKTPIHDHTVWGVIGVLRGGECSRRFEIDPDGKPRPLGEEEILRPGDVCSVSPSIGDVHAVRNAFDDRVSISVHVYGGNIGKISRHVFAPTGGPPKDFVSGYSCVRS